MLKVKVKKLHPDAVVPAYSKIGDAGLDLTAISKTIESDNDNIAYGTGLAIEIPMGYLGLLFPRSSVSKQPLVMANSVGLIDAGFRGEIVAKFKHLYNDSKTYNIGDRVAQLVIIPYPQIELEEVEQLSTTDRGTGGFGSTGN